MCAQRNHHSLQAVRDERDKHRGGIEEEVPQKRTDTAHHKGRERIQQNTGRADDHIVQVQMPAGHRDAERAQGNVHGQQYRRHGQPENGLFLRKRICVFHW